MALGSTGRGTVRPLVPSLPWEPGGHVPLCYLRPAAGCRAEVEADLRKVLLGAGGIFVLRSRAPCPGLGQEVELLGLEEKHRNTQERKPKEIEFVWLPASWISLKAERAR